MSTITSDFAAPRVTVTSDLIIGGMPTPAEEGRYFTTTEAITGEPIAQVAAASASDARRAVDAAAGALPAWAALAPGERREILQRAAALLGERRRTSSR